MADIYKKMNLVMKDIGSIEKDQKNQAQGFKFRGIDQFINSLYPALCKHGVFMAPECVSATNELREVVRGSGKTGVDKHVSILMKYKFYAEDGSSVEVGPIPGEGIDSGDKATNKSLSAALKYALIQTFSIPTEDMTDGDSESPVITTKPKDTSVTSTEATVSSATTTTSNVDASKLQGSTKPAFKKPGKKETKDEAQATISPGSTAKPSSDGGADAEGWN